MLHHIFWNKVFIENCLVFTQDKIPSLKVFSSFCIYFINFFIFLLTSSFNADDMTISIIVTVYNFAMISATKWIFLYQSKFTTFLSKSSPKSKLCTIKMPNMFSRATFGRTNTLTNWKSCLVFSKWLVNVRFQYSF